MRPRRMKLSAGRGLSDEPKSRPTGEGEGDKVVRIPMPPAVSRTIGVQQAKAMR